MTETVSTVAVSNVRRQWLTGAELTDPAVRVPGTLSGIKVWDREIVKLFITASHEY